MAWIACAGLVAAAGCASPADDDGAATGSESDLTAKSAEIVAAGFVAKGSFTQPCPRKYPLPAGCDLWATSVTIARYENADGRVLYLVGDQTWGSFRRGSTLHTSLAEGNGRYRHGRHVLVTLVDYTWTAADGPAAIVDVDVARADVDGTLPATFAGVPLEVRGEVVHAGGVRLARKGLGYGTDASLGMMMTFNGVYGGPAFAALTPQLVELGIGDTFFDEEILREPYGDVPQLRVVPTPAPSDVWRVVAAPEVATGTLKVPTYSWTSSPRCSGGAPVDVSGPSVQACTSGADAGCTADGERFAIHVAMDGVEADVFFTGEAKPQTSSVILDGARNFAGKDARGGDVRLTLEPGGGPWQLVIGGQTYGFPDGVAYDYPTVGCRAHR